jgi:hypothetical protein
LARAVCVLRGITKPNTDQVAEVMTEKNLILAEIQKACKGTNKTKAVMMVLAVIVELSKRPGDASEYATRIPHISDKFEQELLPYTPKECWNRGVSFGMAMQKALAVVEKDWNKHQGAQ